VAQEVEREAVKDHLDRLYALLEQLRSDAIQDRTLSAYDGRAAIPSQGVYFFFEPGELRAEGGSAPRVVRVGTHAVSAASRSTLWTRLRAHRGSRDGRGNHRGSVFRQHVGVALLRRDERELGSWAVSRSASRDVRQQETDMEKQVSAVIGAMRVRWVNVPDTPGSPNYRPFIERNAIALLSNNLNPLDPPSATWLGRYSHDARITRSGLWNLNHVAEPSDHSFLDVMEAAVARTLAA
jgi:hypothetical protein